MCQQYRWAGHDLYVSNYGSSETEMTENVDNFTWRTGRLPYQSSHVNINSSFL